jgi:hypothetical protein
MRSAPERARGTHPVLDAPFHPPHHLKAAHVRDVGCLARPRRHGPGAWHDQDGFPGCRGRALRGGDTIGQQLLENAALRGAQRRRQIRKMHEAGGQPLHRRIERLQPLEEFRNTEVR